MEIEALVSRAEGFDGWSHAERIRLFAWHLHHFGSKDVFRPAQIAEYFDRLALPRPSDIQAFLRSMQTAKPPAVLRVKDGYKLARGARMRFETDFVTRPSAARVTDLLAALPHSVASAQGRTYLEEALRCFSAGAHRAALVMTWILAYDHLCEAILTKHRAAFNASLRSVFPKARVTAINRREDFTELKESQVLQVARTAQIITGSQYALLEEKLDKRNAAAHPSGLTFDAAECETFISGLVKNIVLTI